MLWNNALFGLRLFFILGACIFLQSCGHVRSYDPLPLALENHVEMPGFPGVRSWGDKPSEGLTKSALDSLEQEKAANGGTFDPEINCLALSGGGGDGAFGAGLLCGWTKTGTRPKFKLVTGISTGALMASFAFLGSEYDDKLKESYLTVSDKDIYKEHNFFAIVLSFLNIRPLPSLASHEPLRNLLNRLIDDEMIAAIGKEHLKGRRLLVGTTQLDSQRLVIWDMGAIAASGNPEAGKLFRKILIASASLPATLPPEFFTVEAEGSGYTEMHVDGGVEVQVMLFEDALDPSSVAGKWLQKSTRPRNLYIIRNKKVYPEWQYIKPQIKYVAARTIDSLLKSQSIGDLYRLYAYTKRDGINYNLAFIPKDFNVQATSEFDNHYMNVLFNRAYDMAVNGYIWSHHPPDYED